MEGVWKNVTCPLSKFRSNSQPACDHRQEDANLPSGDEEDEETKPEATLLDHLVALDLLKMMGKVMGLIV